MSDVQKTDEDIVFKFIHWHDIRSAIYYDDRFIEIRAIYNFLRQFNERRFESLKEFTEVALDKVIPYLDAQGVPRGADPKLRQTPLLEKVKVGGEPVFWDYKNPGFHTLDHVVYTPLDTGKYGFLHGGLEEVTHGSPLMTCYDRPITRAPSPRT